jgi:hypothetical protein
VRRHRRRHRSGHRRRGRRGGGGVGHDTALHLPRDPYAPQAAMGGRLGFGGPEERAVGITRD